MRMSTRIPARDRARSESTSRSSSASHPSSPPKSPMSDPWLRWVVASDPPESTSRRTRSIRPPIRSRAIRPIRTAAAQWELDGPRITGPITSLKMLG